MFTSASIVLFASSFSLAQSPLPQEPTTTQHAKDATQPAERVVEPFEGVRVFINDSEPAHSRVEVAAITCLDSGWLEQVACAPATREHESLTVVRARPSHIHAALLLAGFESGIPGRWIYEKDTFDIVSPTGDKLDVRVRYRDGRGEIVEHEIGKWIREAAAGPGKSAKPFPRKPFVFGGSRFEQAPMIPSTPATTAPTKQEPEQYVADISGSVIGLVTFGDEMIGFSVVRSDQEAVQEPTWEANPSTMPEVGTPVTLILRAWPDDTPSTQPASP